MYEIVLDGIVPNRSAVEKFVGVNRERFIEMAGPEKSYLFRPEKIHIHYNGENRHMQVYVGSSRSQLKKIGSIKNLDLKSMYFKMFEINPDRNPIFTAVETLTIPEEMNAFFNDCIEHFKQYGSSLEVREKPEKIVTENIKYITGYYNSQIRNKWMNELFNK